MRDGELFITGRLKDSIIINGVNHWPHDIEWSVEQCHPAIRSGNCCAAFSVDADNGEQLVVAVEIQKSWNNFREIYASVTRAVSEYHDIRLQKLVIVKRGGILKTSSGKVQRSACRTAIQNGSLPVLWTKSRVQNFSETHMQLSDNTEQVEHSKEAGALESWLVHEVSTLVGVGSHEIDVEAPLISFGLGSVDTLALVCQIEDKLQVKLPLAEVLGNGQTIRKLTEALSQTSWSP